MFPFGGSVMYINIHMHTIYTYIYKHIYFSGIKCNYEDVSDLADAIKIRVINYAKEHQGVV